MKWLKSKIKELTELVGQLSKLAIEVIGFIGWILIMIKLFD